MTNNAALIDAKIDGYLKRSGKVRDVFELGDRLLLVATDRISAFDWVLPTGIPDKGRVLSGLSGFWFDRLGISNHYIGELETSGIELSAIELEELSGRAMVVRKANVIAFECVVRGYLSGSGWKEYRDRGTVCGEALPRGLVESDAVEPIFTPATKAESGHDENVPFSYMQDSIGCELAQTLRDRSLEIYREAAAYARSRGLILADTKFEWGIDPKTGELILIDEVLTPDSARYWDESNYRPGGAQPSFDKQFVRDWLETTGWDKASPPPPLPGEIVAKTRDKYIKAYEILTNKPFPWK